MRTRSYAIIVILVLWPLHALALSCAKDLNGNGVIDQANEAATCTSTPQGALCPIGAAQCTGGAATCPLGNFACTNGQCTQSGSCTMKTRTVSTAQSYACPINPGVTYTTKATCETQCLARANFFYRYVFNGWAPPGVAAVLNANGNACTAASTTQTQITEYQCSLNNQVYSTQTACQSACNKTAACTQGTPTCPTDPNLPCKDVGGGNYQCSPTACQDMTTTAATTNPGVTTTTVDTSMPNNSGPRDANGNCLGAISIFAGRGMNCKKAGLRSGFHDCCDDGAGGVIADSMGASVSAQIKQAALSTMAKFAATAVANFAGGATASAATSSAAATVFTPAGLAFTAAAIVVQYLIQPKCSRLDMETAALVGSKFCHYVGTYCSEKWKIIGCVQKKATYCCFNSMLGRIIHEQGRSQLTSFQSPIGVWGTATKPLCRGFSPDEFQSLDFGAMDLTEYFGYIRQVAGKTIGQGVPQQSMKNAVQSFYNGLR